MDAYTKEFNRLLAYAEHLQKQLAGHGVDFSRDVTLTKSRAFIEANPMAQVLDVVNEVCLLAPGKAMLSQRLADIACQSSRNLQFEN